MRLFIWQAASMILGVAMFIDIYLEIVRLAGPLIDGAQASDQP